MKTNKQTTMQMTKIKEKSTNKYMMRLVYIDLIRLNGKKVLWIFSDIEAGDVQPNEKTLTHFWYETSTTSIWQ